MKPRKLGAGVVCMRSWKTHSWWKNHYISSNWKWDEVHRKLFSSCTHFALYKHESSAYGKRLCEFSVGKVFTVRKFLPKILPHTYENLKRIFHSFPSSNRKYKVKTLKGKFFKHFHYAPAQKSFQFEFPQFFASPLSPLSALSTHRREKNEKFKHFSSCCWIFLEKSEERPGEILKINLIIAIATTESVASHRIFPRPTHTHPLFLSLFPLFWPSWNPRTRSASSQNLVVLTDAR